MNTTQTITLSAGAMGTGITFPTPIYNKVSVIIEEQENVPGLTGKAVLLWSGNNIDFTACVATSAFTDRTEADGSTSLGVWWDSGDIGVVSPFMKVQIYNGDVAETQTVTESVADSTTQSTITHSAFTYPPRVGQGITIANHTGAEGDTRMNGDYTVATVTDTTHTVINKTAGNLLPATTFDIAIAEVASATAVTFTGYEGSRSLVVGEEIEVTSWPTYTALNQTYTVSDSIPPNVFEATAVLGGLLPATTFMITSAYVIIPPTHVQFTFTGGTRSLVVGEKVPVTSWPSDSQLNQEYIISEIVSSTQFNSTTATGLLDYTAFTPVHNCILSTTELLLTHGTPTPVAFLVVGQEVTLDNYNDMTLNQSYTVQTIISATEVLLTGSSLVVIDLVATSIEATSTTEATLTHATRTFVVGQLVSLSGTGSFYDQIYAVNSTSTTESTELTGTGLTTGGGSVAISTVQLGDDVNDGSALTGNSSGMFYSVVAQGDITGIYNSVSAQGDITGVYNTAAGSPIAATTPAASHDYDINVKFN